MIVLLVGLNDMLDVEVTMVDIPLRACGMGSSCGGGLGSVRSETVESGACPSFGGSSRDNGGDCDGSCVQGASLSEPSGESLVGLRDSA